MRRFQPAVWMCAMCAIAFLLVVSLGSRAQGPSAAVSPTPVPGRIRVTVWITGPDQKKSPAPGAVVWLPGSSGGASQPFRISSRNKRFEPRITAVPAGSQVDFPNFDRIHHNVFSLSEKAKFDLGLYKNGASRRMTFDNPGLFRIYCNIHPQMAAFLLVLDGKVFAQTGPDGTALLPAVPQGRHPVKVWEEKGGEWLGTAEVTAGKITSLTVVLNVSAWREIPHKRKDGTDYPPPDDDENRY